MNRCSHLQMRNVQLECSEEASVFFATKPRKEVFRCLTLFVALPETVLDLLPDSAL